MHSRTLYCPYCSSKLEHEGKESIAGKIVCPVCGKSAAKQDFSVMLHCPSCRKKLAVPADLTEQSCIILCPQCGREFNAAAAADAEKPLIQSQPSKLRALWEQYYVSPRKIRKAVLILIPAVLLAFLIFSPLFRSAPAEKKKTAPAVSAAAVPKIAPEEVLKAAIKAGDTEAMAKALKTGATLSFDDPDSGNAVQLACRAKQFKSVEFLLKNGCSANDFRECDAGKAEYPLEIAFRNRTLEIFRLLLDGEGDSGKLLPDGSGNFEPLFARIIRYFAQTPHEAIPYLEAMLEHGWNVNTSDSSGRTAVWIGCECCSDPSALLEYLRARGAAFDLYVNGISFKERFGSRPELKKIFAQETCTKKPFPAQLEAFCAEKERYFSEKKPQLNEDVLAQKTWSLWKKKINIPVKAERKSSSSRIDRFKSNQFKNELEKVIASRQGTEFGAVDLQLLKKGTELLEKGEIDPDLELLDAKNRWHSRTLLHYAAAGKLAPADRWIAALLAAGASAESIRFEELTPECAGNLALILPCCTCDLSALCNVPMVSRLLETPDPAFRAGGGLKRDLKPFIRLFQLHPALALWKEKFNGRTLLHYAVEENSEELLHMLIATGNADKNAVDALGFSAYYRAQLCGSMELAEILHECDLSYPLTGAQMTQVEFARALRDGKVKKVAALLKKGVDLLLPVRYQLNAVQYAVHRKFLKILTELLNAHADPNAFIEPGYPLVSNPLAIAVLRNSPECFELLLRHKMDLKREMTVFHLGRGLIAQRIIEQYAADPGKAQPFFVILKKYGWNCNQSDSFGRSAFWCSCAYTQNAQLIVFLATEGGNWDHDCFGFTPRELVTKNKQLYKQIFEPPKEQGDAAQEPEFMKRFRENSPLRKLSQ